MHPLRRTSQAALLIGVGVGIVGGWRPAEPGAAPPVNCSPESSCGFKKPLLLFVLDYSTSMNKEAPPLDSRWESLEYSISSAAHASNGYLVTNYIVGMMRYGHDPSPNPGTTIPMDTSGLVDGVKLDVPFYDINNFNKYYECDQADRITAALESIPPPLSGKPTGIHSYTKGALSHARDYFAQTLADHPADADPLSPRLRSIVLVTDGEWTNPAGSLNLWPADENPASVAAALYDEDNIPVHVITIGEAHQLPFADELAAAGGTTAAHHRVHHTTAAIHDILEQQSSAIVTPTCSATRPHVMFLLDASSSMLNLQGGAVRAKQGEGGWEQARESIAGYQSFLEEPLFADNSLDPLAHVGLTVFGSAEPDDTKRVVQYGPCHRANIEWALDPANSCGPGCDDPYADAPISWTYQDGALVPPNFADTTLSHMPRCIVGLAPNKGCFGSGTYTHLGLLAVQANLAAHKAACSQPNAELACTDTTQFINILITDGLSNSTPAQYSPPLLQMYEAGVITHVIGFGDGVDSPQAVANLTDMAALGSGGQVPYHDANNQLQLEAALDSIRETFNFDPCCTATRCGPLYDSDSYADTEPASTSETTASETTTDASSDASSTSNTSSTSATTSDTTTGTDSAITASESTATTDEQTTSSTSSTSSTTSTSTTTTSDPPTSTSGDPPASTSGDAPTTSITSTGDTTSDPPQDPTAGTVTSDCACDTRTAPSTPLALAVLLLLRRRRS